MIFDILSRVDTDTAQDDQAALLYHFDDLRASDTWRIRHSDGDGLLNHPYDLHE